MIAAVRGHPLFATHFPLTILQTTGNIFDNLPALVAPTAAELRDELDRYLSTDPEVVDNVLMWWTDRRSSFPCLSWMALDYLTIPGPHFCSH